MYKKNYGFHDPHYGSFWSPDNNDEACTGSRSGASAPDQLKSSDLRYVSCLHVGHSIYHPRADKATEN